MNGVLQGVDTKRWDARGGNKKSNEIHRVAHIERNATKSSEQKSVEPTATPDDERGKDDDLAAIVRDLRSDEGLRVFLSPDFTVEAHVGAAVREERLSPALSAASRAAEMLNSKMHQEIIRRQDDLLRGVESLDALQVEIATVSEGVSGIGKATEGLNNSLAKPYRDMDMALRKLRNLNVASELLRGLGRALRSLQSLKDANLYPTFASSVETPHERLVLAAAGVAEIESLLPKISNSSLVSSAIIPMRRAKAELRKRATTAIKMSLNFRNEPSLTSALKALKLLGLQAQVLASEVNRLTEMVSSTIAKVFDPSTATSVDSKRTSLRSMSSNVSKSSSGIWSRVETMLTAIKDAGQEIIMLEKVTVTQDGPNDDANQGHGLYKRWLESIGRAVERYCGALLRRSKESYSSSASNLIMLIDIYPSLRARVIELDEERLPQSSQTLLRSLSGLEVAYLTTSFTRITDAVDTVFEQRQDQDSWNTSRQHETKVEEDDDESQDARVERVIGICQSELQRAKDGREMYQQQVNNIAKGMRLFISHASDLCEARNSKYTTSSRAAWDSRRVYQGLVKLCRSAQEWSRNAQPGSGNSPIEREIRNGNMLLSRIMSKLLQGVQEEIQASIVTIQSATPEVVLAAVRTILEEFCKNIARNLTPSAPLGRGMRALARSTLSTFVRNVLVLDFREQESRRNVEKSAAKLEEIVSLICDPLSCGSDYRALRSLRIMLKMPINAFSDTDNFKRLTQGLAEFQIMLYLTGTTGFVLPKEDRVNFIKWLDTVSIKEVANRIEKHTRDARRENPNEKAWKVIDRLKTLKG